MSFKIRYMYRGVIFCMIFITASACSELPNIDHLDGGKADQDLTAKNNDQDIDTDTDSDTNLGSDADTDTDSDSDSDTDSDTDIDSDTDTDSDVDTDTDSDIDSDTDTDSGVDTDTNSDSHIDSNSHTGLDTGDTENNTDISSETTDTNTNKQMLPTGDRCEDPIIIPSEIPKGGYETYGNTASLTSNTFILKDMCIDHPETIGANASDAIYKFKPAIAGTYTFILNSEFDAVLYLTDVCIVRNPTNCVGIDKQPIPAMTESITVPLIENKTYYLVVDGVTSDEAGDYMLSVSEPCLDTCDNKVCGESACGISCGKCLPDTICTSDNQCIDAEKGDYCDAPIVIDTYPVNIEIDPMVFQNNYELNTDNCAGLKDDLLVGPDIFFEFTAQVTGSHTINVSPSSTTYTNFSIFIYDDCNFDVPCILGSDESTNGIETIKNVELTKEKTIIIGVDTIIESPLYQPFTLKITGPCTETCPPMYQQCVEGECKPLPDGSTCETAIHLDLNEVKSANTGKSPTSNYGLNGECGGRTVNNVAGSSPDKAYHFVPQETGTYEIKLFDASYDALFYLLKESCDDVIATCIDYATIEHFRSEETENAFFADLTTNSTYYIIVDGNAQDSLQGGFVGSFSIQITSTQ